MSQPIERSIVLPAFNEEEGLSGVVHEIAAVLRESGKSFEIIVVDDGSADRTWQVIGELAAKHPEIRAIRFARNFGHQLAVHAGIKSSTGGMVAIMDSDGQDPPGLLPEMFELLSQGNDVVNCIRKQRKESIPLRLCYFLFYRLYRRLVPFKIPLDSGDFSAMNRRTADLVASVVQHNPFVRGIRGWAGGRQVDLAYERPCRQAGTTKYGLSRLLLLALSGVTAFSRAPLRLSILLGLAISILSVVYAVFVVAAKLLTGYPEGYAGWASLAFLVSFLGGANLTVMGIIGEYLGHVYDAVRGMPPFHVTETIGFPAAPAAPREREMRTLG